MSEHPEAPPTIVEVTYPPHRGSIGLRGSREPLSWGQTLAPTASEGERHLFVLDVPPGEVIEMKLVRNEEDWAAGRNYSVHAGERLELWPCFERELPIQLPTEGLETAQGLVIFDVLLPPSYDEQETRRYPVLYVLDGQSLWSHSQDPFGVWHLDRTLAGLYELDAVEEMIVVGVHTADSRLERMSPVPDPTHGGGQGQALLDAIVDGLRPVINERFRTRADRESTAIMGSSMGGLFAFFAAWTRPEIFGKAACLSSSFWWSNRWAVRAVQEQGPRELRPLFYIDSGASMNAHEGDANLRDGFHHTRSMLRALLADGYTLGTDLHRLVFAGHAHNAESWSSRVALPLQLLFPPASRPADPPPAPEPPPPPPVPEQASA